MLIVREGRVLIIDEADKAPLEVVSILKGLVEDGEMLLSDGRRIVPPNVVSNSYSHDNSNASQLSNGCSCKQTWLSISWKWFFFCLWRLFQLVSAVFVSNLDLFLCSHPIDNPDEQSEMFLLKQYAPSVPDDTLKNLTGMFIHNFFEWNLKLDSSSLQRLEEVSRWRPS